MRSDPGLRWAGLAVVFSLGAWLLLPAALAGSSPYPPDAVEHLAIANAWVHGAGFVDPIQYNFYLGQTAPLPAFAVRAPVVPALLSLPLAFGLRATEVGIAHACWAVIVIASSYWLLSRIVHPLSAAITMALIVSATAFRVIAISPLTETTALLAIVLVVVSSRGAVRSIPAALVCAAATWIAWLTRPNLGSLVAVVALGAVWHLGSRAAFRSGPLRAYLLCFTGLCLLTVLTVEMATGIAPYAGYGVTLQHLKPSGWHRYDVEYHGVLSFVIDHFDQIRSQVFVRIGQVFRAVCLSSTHSHLGWLGAVALAHAIWRFRCIRMEQAVANLAVGAFAAALVANYNLFDPGRFPLQLTAACAIAGVMAAEDAFGLWRGDRRRALSTALLRKAGLGLAGAAVLITSIAVVMRWPAREAGADTPFAPGRATRLCQAMNPDSLVATRDPWTMHVACGNPTIRLPTDLDKPGLLDRFLDERRPGYVVSGWRRFLSNDRLVETANAGPMRVFEVPEFAHQPTTWIAPPALVCAGGGVSMRTT